MGIHNLNKLLRKHCPDIFETIHLSEYAYKKVAVDVENQINTIQDEWKMPNLTTADSRTKTNGILAQVKMLEYLGGDPSKIAGLTDLLTTTGAQQPAPAANQIRGNKPGAPTTQDYANLEKRLQQAMAAQGQTQ